MDLKVELPVMATVNEQLPAVLPLTVKPLAVLVTEQLFAFVDIATESPSEVFAFTANDFPTLSFVAMAGGAGVSSEAVDEFDEPGCVVIAGELPGDVARGATVVAGVVGSNPVVFCVDCGFATAVHSV